MRPDLPAGEPPDAVRAPDDASELSRDVLALRRERRVLARRSRLNRMAAGRSGSGVGAPLVGGVLLVVAVFASLPVLLRPDLDGDQRSRPLAAPTAAPGTVGGLLPEVVLRTPAGPLSARDTARPGVVVLVPPRCGCDPAVREIVQQAREFTKNLRIVTDGRAPGAVAEADRLRLDVSRGLARSATDPTGALLGAYGAVGATALVLEDDGVVLDVVRNIQPGQRLESRFRVLRPIP